MGRGIFININFYRVISKSNVLATSASLILVLKLARLQHYFPLIERRGLEMGLLFLMMSVLVPFAGDQISTKTIIKDL